MIMRAIVIDNADPDNLGRVKVNKFGAVVDRTAEVSPWVYPMQLVGGGVDSGAFLVPEVGSSVFVMQEDDLFETLVYVGAPVTTSSKPLEGNTNVKVLYKSNSGHTIVVNDEQGEEFVRITDRLGQVIEMSCKSVPKTKARGTNLSTDEEPEFTVENSLEQTSSISITDLGKNSIQLTTIGDVTSITVNSPAGNVNVNADKLSINGGKARVLTDAIIPFCRFTGEVFHGAPELELPSGEEEEEA